MIKFKCTYCKKENKFEYKLSGVYVDKIKFELRCLHCKKKMIMRIDMKKKKTKVEKDDSGAYIG